jgi:ribosomal protein L16 Arg81 hydroxylase
MSTTDFDLGKLLAPTPTDAFFRDTWERQPLAVQRGAPRYYAGLFSLADVDSVIAFSRPRFAEHGVFAGASPVSRSCVQGWLAEQLGPTDACRHVAELHHVYEQGKTIIIRGMQHRWPTVASLCRHLEGAIHCPVHGNLYLTPPNSQGFDAHLDAHEVFALQLDGVKHWRLYGPAAVLPLAGDKASVPRAELGPPREITL